MHRNGERERDYVPYPVCSSRCGAPSNPQGLWHRKVRREWLPCTQGLVIIAAGASNYPQQASRSEIRSRVCQGHRQLWACPLLHECVKGKQHFCPALGKTQSWHPFHTDAFPSLSSPAGWEASSNSCHLPGRVKVSWQQALRITTDFVMKMFSSSLSLSCSCPPAPGTYG